jgi:hypothetical protein
MEPMDDLPLDPSPQPPDYRDEPRPFWPWIAGLAVVVVVVAFIVYMRWQPTPAPPQSLAAPTAPAQSDPRRVLGPSVNPMDLPPLDQMDGVLRELIKQLSSRPEALAWLATDGLIRNMAVCIENVAEGKSPAPHLRPLAPASAFRAAGRLGGLTIDARSYQRYDGIARAVGELDASGVARFYTSIKPRLDQAFQELGHARGDIDINVERALLHVIDTPAVAPSAPLIRAVLSYRFEDEAVEGLSGAQKQLLRMGPRNAQTIQVKLREIARALGIPEGRLPKPPRS